MGKFVADDGAALWFDTSGPVDGGLPLVLCHGGPGMWDNLASLATLLDGERLVVRWDQRGCGRSGSVDGPYSTTQCVADLDALRRHLGAPRWVVGGHSWGASLALRAVLASPATSAALLYVSGTGVGRAWYSHYKAAIDERLTAGQRARRDVLEEMVERTPEQEVEWRLLRWAPDHGDRTRALELAASDASAPWPLNLSCNTAITAETKTWDANELLEQCRSFPGQALFLHGALDPRPPFAIEELAAAVPNATVRIVATAGHQPWLEDPEAVVRSVRPWLSSLDQNEPAA